jgi:hypothetical protein
MIRSVILRMKQASRLTRSQKECVSAHYLNAKDWRLVEETEFYLKIIHKETGKRKNIDKFRRSKR